MSGGEQRCLLPPPPAPPPPRNGPAKPMAPPADTATPPAPHTREKWVDTARALAILPILALHAGGTTPVLVDAVSGALCFYFVLSGYFMPPAAKPWLAAKRALRLGLAWVLWSLLTLGLLLLFCPGESWSWAQVFGIGCTAYNAPLWFLRNLFLFELILAGLAALRLLPRYNWLVLILLSAGKYATVSSQSDTLSFVWLPAVMLGYCLRSSISLRQLRHHLTAYAPALIATGALLLLQQEYYPHLLPTPGETTTACSLPVKELTWALGYPLIALGLVRLFPRLSTAAALAGSSMLFIYAAHSLAFAPFYVLGLPTWVNLSILLLLLPLLTLACQQLRRGCPLLMRLLMAR